MITKNTTNRNYPKPDASNFLQDDVNRITGALDMIDTDIHDLNTTKANQTTMQSALAEIAEIKSTKVDQTTFTTQLASLQQKVYGTAYDIIGPTLAFQYARDLTYSIEIPDAISYAWTATDVTITSGTTSKAITVNTGNTSGSVSVSVTTAAGDIVQKNLAITVNQFKNIQTFTYSGSIASWYVPENVELIKIEAWGAGGGNGYSAGVFKQYGGKGARMKGEFNVIPGEKLLILVGGKGGEYQNSYTNGVGAGGGGSFVVKVDPNSATVMTVLDREKVTPLLIAGGGGGGGIGINGQIYDGGNGLTSTVCGEAIGKWGGRNGLGGEASQYGGGGAGFSGDGTFPNGVLQPKSFLNGGAGGTYNTYAKSAGGFGGGGGADLIPGGGGGYSGGASGGTWATSGRSGGGGSYNVGTNQNNMEGVQTGHGKVQISW